MYSEFYGFSEPPFNLTPNSRFLFLSERHQEALSALIYGVEHRKGFICLSGEIGSGKTTLYRTLLSRLDRERTNVSVILNSYLSDLELLKTINEEFGLLAASNSKKDLLDELNQFLMEEYKQHNNCILILDEAQNLRPETLEQIRMISNLETETDKLIQIIMVGQPELRRTLALPELEQLNQRITVRHHITALSEEEVGDYIFHRLSVANPEHRIVFTPQALRLIYHYTRGVPRRINVICDHCLIGGFSLGRFEIDGTIVEQAVRESRGETYLQAPAPQAAGHPAAARATAAAHPAGAPPAQVARPKASKPPKGRKPGKKSKPKSGPRSAGPPAWLAPFGAGIGLVAVIAAGVLGGFALRDYVDSRKAGTDGTSGGVSAAGGGPASGSAFARTPDDAAAPGEPDAGIELVSPGPASGPQAGSASSPTGTSVAKAPAPPPAEAGVRALVVASSAGSGAAASGGSAAPGVSTAAPAVAPGDNTAGGNPDPAPAPVPAPVANPVRTPVPAVPPAPDSAPAADWQFDSDGILRVTGPELSQAAAFLTIMNQWGVGVDLADFRDAPAEAVAQYDMVEMLKQIQFHCMQTKDFNEARRLNLPVLMRRSGASRPGEGWQLLSGLAASEAFISDPVRGLIRQPERNIYHLYERFVVAYPDRAGITGARAGDSGDHVRAVQNFLLSSNLTTHPADGRFDKSTTETVQRFQRDNRLKDSGVVDNATAALILSRTLKERPGLTK